MKLPLTDDEYKYIYSKVPRLNVEIVLRTDSGVVLVKRDIEPWKDYWHLPGGRVYMNETPEQAVVRIAKYETGLEVTVTELLDTITYSSIKDTDSKEWPIGIVYSAKVTGGKLSGSQVGEEIGAFHALPTPVIEEQRIFLEALRP